MNSQTRIDRLDTQGEGATPRFLHACERAGIVTLEDLAAYGAQKFSVIKHCGHRTVAEARGILKTAGLIFQDEVPLSPIKLIKEDIQIVKNIRPCHDCERAVATHVVRIDVRAGGATIALDGEFCIDCANELAEALRESLPETDD